MAAGFVRRRSKKRLVLTRGLPWFGCHPNNWRFSPQTPRRPCSERRRAEWADKPGSVIGRPFILEDALPRSSSRATRARTGPVHSAPICLFSRWGLPSRVVAGALVRSCRTVSAFLPMREKRLGEFSFLWRYPSGRPARPLAGILPCGARTFLTVRVTPR